MKPSNNDFWNNIRIKQYSQLGITYFIFVIIICNLLLIYGAVKHELIVSGLSYVMILTSSIFLLDSYLMGGMNISDYQSQSKEDQEIMTLTREDDVGKIVLFISAGGVIFWLITQWTGMILVSLVTTLLIGVGYYSNHSKLRKTRARTD